MIRGVSTKFIECQLSTKFTDGW